MEKSVENLTIVLFMMIMLGTHSLWYVYQMLSDTCCITAYKNSLFAQDYKTEATLNVLDCQLI